MRAREIMTTQVTCGRADLSLELAAALMLEKRISGLPILDAAGRLVGIVTEGDLVARREIGTARPHPAWIRYLLSPGRLAAAYARECGHRVGDAMTREVVTASPETPLDDIVGLMARRRIRRVPIVEDGRLVGIVTRADLLRALHDALRAAREAPPREDAAIRTDVEAACLDAGVIPLELIDVAVEDGAVTLRGALTDERQRPAIRAAAEGVPGVRVVHDHLTLVDPLSGLARIALGDEPEGEARTR
ncbi:CBS domain containing membrane protein [Methylobacterium sp. 4-46]|uniref:CBS domain-containing protein n=1 Tax=unclassified Methylobacterium TaxID=2615210 RepID=UPI000152E081|nr:MULTISPECIES: CBS domain-containing protein [Methylobacterium]ACA17951.1 CBS domain containing membrane protein [Methylobacterium sp. 4-46]WFT77252.1 CBS domain-containing protein [Methylobacterium nodulans]